MRKTPVLFTVVGSGDFPFDMLRYDACWPVAPADVRELIHGSEWRRKRRLTLASMRDNAPNIHRWESFDWKVELGEKRDDGAAKVKSNAQ